MATPTPTEPLSLSDCIECRGHRADYYADLAMGVDPSVARAALRGRAGRCDTYGDTALVAFAVTPVARGLADTVSA